MIHRVDCLRCQPGLEAQRAVPRAMCTLDAQAIPSGSSFLTLIRCIIPLFVSERESIMKKGDKVRLKSDAAVPAVGWIPKAAVGTVVFTKVDDQTRGLLVDVDFGVHGVLWAQFQQCFEREPNPGEGPFSVNQIARVAAGRLHALTRRKITGRL